MSLSDKITDSANCFCDVIPTEDVKEFIRELKEDEVYYFRQCPKCGKGWKSLHCICDGCQGTCPNCGTIALSFPDDECKCEFHMSVDKIDKLVGDKLI